VNHREIRRRISSVKETVKITRAMYSISVAKMMRARATLPAAERFYDRCREVLAGIAAAPSPYFKERGKRTAFIVIGGDKGLCGDYNQTLFESAYQTLKEREERYLFIVGGVAREMLSKAGIEADVEFLHSAENPSPEASYSMAADLMTLYHDGLLDEIVLVYSRAEGDHSVVPVERLLPFVSENAPELPTEGVKEAAVERAVYEYLAAALYKALISSSLAEHLARVRAMPQATENGEKMIETLTSEYNKARQEGITRALADVGSREEEYGQGV